MNYKTTDTQKYTETHNLDFDLKNGSILMVNAWPVNSHTQFSISPTGSTSKSSISRLNENQKVKNQRDGINLWASGFCTSCSALSEASSWQTRNAKNDNVILIYDSKVKIVMNISEPAFSVFDDDEEFWMTFRVRHLSWGGKWESPENFQFDVCLGWLRMRVGEWWIFLALALRWGGVNGNERGGWVENELEFWMRNTKQTSWQLCFVSWHAINSKYLSSRRSTASHRLS